MVRAKCGKGWRSRVMYLLNILDRVPSLSYISSYSGEHRRDGVVTVVLHPRYECATLESKDKMSGVCFVLGLVGTRDTITIKVGIGK